MPDDKKKKTVKKRKSSKLVSRTAAVAPDTIAHDDPGGKSGQFDDYSDAEIKLFLDNELNGFGLADKDHFIHVNNSLANMLGLSVKELLDSRTEKLFAMVHPDDREFLIDQFKKKLAGSTKTVKSYYFRIIRPDGEIRWLSIYSKRVKHDGIPALLLTAIDITEQKLTEIALEREIDFNSAILETIGSLIIVMNADGKIVSFNRECERTTGYSFEELKNTCLWDKLLPSVEIESVKKVFKSLIAGDYPNKHENHWLTKNGEKKLISWTNTSIADSRGKVEYVIGTGIDVTEDRKAELKLKASDLRYQQLFNNSPVPMWVMDLSMIKTWIEEVKSRGISDLHTFLVNNPQEINDLYNKINVIERNKNTVTLFKVPTQERLMPRFFSRAFTQESIPGLIQGLTALFSGEKYFTFELRLTNYENELLSFLMKVNIPDEYLNSWSRVMVSADDLTEMKRAMDALAQSEKRYQGLFEETPVGIWEEDFSETKKYIDYLSKEKNIKNFRKYFTENPDEAMKCISMFKVLDFNKATLKLYKTPSKEVLLGNFNSLYWKDSYPDLVNALMTLADGSNICEFQTVNYDYYGDKIYVLIRALIVPQYEDTWSRVFISMEDLTGQKVAEESLIEHQRALSALMSNLPGIAYRCKNDPHWTMEFISDGCLPLTGYKPEDLIGNRRLSYADLIHPDDRQPIWDTVQKSLSEKVAFRLEYRILHADGSVKWVWEQGGGVFSHEGELIALEGFISDINARKKAEEELAQHRQNLEQIIMSRTRELEVAQEELIKRERFAYLGQLTAMVSHELRNPLGTIRTSVYTLNETLDNGDLSNIDRVLERIERNVTRCDLIIEELLDLTRNRDLLLNRCRLDELIEEAVNEYENKDGIKIELDLLPGAVASLDKERIRRSLLNIFENACHAMKEDGTKEHHVLRISTDLVNDNVRIRITDNGSGIPAEELSKVFEPLYSTKSFGIGLGLPIVKQIIEQHGGKIELTSIVGKGTTVCILLPVRSDT